MQIPRMTVVMMVDLQRERGTNCLQSLLAQSNIDELEILLFDDRAEIDGPLPGSDHPSVRILHFPAMKSYGNVIYEGILEARAPIVTLIEEHCIAYPGWAEALIRAHELPYAAVSGEIYCGNPGSGASDIIFNFIYWATSAPRERGETVHWIAQNSSFKRDILLQYGDELRDLFQSHLLLQLRLQGDGYKLYSEPDSKMAHANESYIRSHWVGIFHSNWAFGATRARIYQWSLLKRAFYILIAPLAPWIRLFRQFFLISSERPQVLSVNLRNIIPIWTFHAMAVLGQAFGLILGQRKSAERFLYFEVNEYRAIEGVHVKKIFTRLLG